MSGKPIFIDISNNNSYMGPKSTIGAMDYIKSQNERTKDNKKKLERSNGGLDVFHHHPAEWWAIRRLGLLEEGGVVPCESNSDRSIELLLSDLVEKNKTDRIWDWLHDDNLIKDVYICHYQSTKEATVEKTEKRTIGKFFNRSSVTTTETTEEKVICVGFLFVDPQDAVNFKLACL